MRKMLMASAALVASSGIATMSQAQSPVAATAAATVPVPDNVLLKPFVGAYDGVPQWDKVTPAAFDQAFAFAIAEQQREIDAITANPAAPTFANTIEPYQKAGERLDRVDTYFGLMTSNVTTPEYQALDKVWSPKLSAASDAIRFDPKLFARIKAVYDARSTSGLDAKQARLVTDVGQRMSMSTHLAERVRTFLAESSEWHRFPDGVRE